MAIACEFIDVFIPVSKIEAVYPGGYSEFHKKMWGRVLCDGHLVREGAMSPADVQVIVQDWERRGLQPFRIQSDGKLVWNDLCVVESLFGGPTLPCDWIAVDPRERCAWLKCEPKGEIVRS